jgi:hypothetical protein
MKDPRCTLPVLSFTINDREVPEHHDNIRDLYLYLVDIVVIELLDGNAKQTFSGSQIIHETAPGKILRMDTNMKNATWQVWLQSEANPNVLTQALWFRDETTECGPVHAAISQRFKDARGQMSTLHPYYPDADISIRFDLDDISAHQRLRMVKARADALS